MLPLLPGIPKVQNSLARLDLNLIQQIQRRTPVRRTTFPKQHLTDRQPLVLLILLVTDRQPLVSMVLSIHIRFQETIFQVTVFQKMLLMVMEEVLLTLEILRVIIRVLLLLRKWAV